MEDMEHALLVHGQILENKMVCLLLLLKSFNFGSGCGINSIVFALKLILSASTLKILRSFVPLQIFQVRC